jgi:hypothetical protein
MRRGLVIASRRASNRLTHSGIVGAVVCAAGILAACSGVADPGADAPVHPMVGTYDFAVSLATYSYPDPASSCVPYCTDVTVTAPVGSTLAGTLVIANSVVAVSNGVRFPVASANLSETDCSGTPCSSRTATFTSADVTLASDTLSGSGFGNASGEFLSLAGRFAGDTLTGTVEWAVNSGRAMRRYTGTYVARRRR